MKSQETKNRFVQLRAEKKSYSYIAKELGISKSTCTDWERECKDAISQLKAEQLEELYEAYGMSKEARIKGLGETLEKINKALTAVDLEAMPPEKLLDFKLKYTQALKEEYISLNTASVFKGKATAEEILEAVTELYLRVKAGETTTEQAQREMAVLQNLLKAYDTAEIKAKLDALESIIGGRG